MRARGLGLLMLLGCLALSASASNWEPVHTSQGREDIGTWVRHVDGMSVKAFRGVTEVHYNALHVLALIADIPNLPSWVFHCRSASQPSGWPGEYTYARFKGIWPASDRDVLMHSTVTQQGDGTIVIDTEQASGYPIQEDLVRMPYLHNSFRITPLRGGWSRVEFETQVDVGGWIPSWIANLVATEAPVVTLEGMKQQLPKTKYQIRSIDELPTYYLKGKSIVMPPGHITSQPDTP